MSGTRWNTMRALALLLPCFLAPQLLTAQPIVPDINAEIVLSYTIAPIVGVTVRSSVRAYLYNVATGQPLQSQIIAGHGVADLTANVAIYEHRLVSNTGDASETAFTTGVFYHCYETDLSAHVDAYSLHRIWGVGPVCAEPYDTKPEPPPKENCPILLDLRQDGFHLSGPNPPVRFDIDADGTAEELAWTEADGDDAFLCWDRNNNGIIDDGSELFGYATPLLSGRPAKIGYRALAELDRPELGGNEDGRVDAHDARFRTLCAWLDTNRDGVSQADEIHSLDEVEVAALEFDYKPTRIQDQYGNLFRYVSHVEMYLGPSHSTRWPTYDVIFAEP